MRAKYTYTESRNAIKMAMAFIAWLKKNNKYGRIHTEASWRTIILRVGVDAEGHVIVKAYLPEKNKVLIGINPHIGDDKKVSFEHYDVFSDPFGPHEAWGGAITLAVCEGY